MNKVFIYWDNSNIFIEAQYLADEMNHDFYSRYRVRLHFEIYYYLRMRIDLLKKHMPLGRYPRKWIGFGLVYEIRESKFPHLMIVEKRQRENNRSLISFYNVKWLMMYWIMNQPPSYC